MEYSDSDSDDQDDKSEPETARSTKREETQVDEDKLIKEGPNKEMVKDFFKKNGTKKLSDFHRLEVSQMQKNTNEALVYSLNTQKFESVQNNMPSIFSKRGSSFDDASKSPYVSYHQEDGNSKDIETCNLIINGPLKALSKASSASLER